MNHPARNAAGAAGQNIADNDVYDDTIIDDYLEPVPDYMEIDEMVMATRGNNTETVTPDVNNYVDEYQPLDATPAELATWRDQVETGNTGLYQDLVNDPVGTAEGWNSEQYYNMSDIVQGKEP